MSTINIGTSSTTAFKVESDTTGALLIKTGATPTLAMTVDASQNVGIGVTPSAWGVNQKAVQLPCAALFSDPGGNNNASFVSNAYYDGANWKYVATNYATWYQHQNGAHTWYTAPSGTAGNAITWTTAMTLEATGLFRVNGTVAGGEVAILNNATATNPYGLTVNFSGADPNNASQWVFRGSYSGNNIYTIWSNGTITARSDARHKQDIEPARGYLSDLCKVEVVRYRWKSNPEGTKELGFLAQQVEQVMPGLVHTEGEGNAEFKSIKTSVFIPMLVKAIQELAAEVAALKGAK